jgi:outer membrane protein assembly factor BamB
MYLQKIQPAKRYKEMIRIGGILSFILASCVLITILLTSGPRAQLASSPWPVFRHDSAHTGQSQYDTSANKGLENWGFVYPDPAKDPGFSLFSSPTIGADGTIYSTPGDNNLYAFDPDGTRKWTYTAPWPMSASPAIGADGTIYATSLGDISGGYLYAVSPDGTLKWTFQTGFSLESSPAIASDGTIYVYCDDGKLYAVNSDGTEKWDLAAGFDGTNELSSPAIASDGTIYFGSADYNLYAVNPNGTLKWAFATPGDVESSPAVGSDGTIYVGTEYSDGYPNSIAYLLAINPDGSLKWQYTTLNYWVISSPAIGTDGTIYFGDGRSIRAVNPDGTFKWQVPIEEQPVRSSPSIGADGTVYIGADDGNVYAVNPDGSVKWKFPAGDSSGLAIIGSAPAIGADGTIYINVYPFGPTCLYALGKGAPPTPTPTPTPVAGKLQVSPNALDFGHVYLGAQETRSVKITNLGKVTKKRPPPSPILIEGESGVNSPFSLAYTCTNKELAPRSRGKAPGSCEVSVTFTPAEAVRYSGSLIIKDNLEPGFGQSVSLAGSGRARK